jgi:hypothetical protein
MNAFRTEWKPTAALPTLDYGTPVLTTGSCFADRFGNWLAENKFSVLTNPFGVSYQPLAIHHQLLAALNRQSVRAEHAVMREGRFVHLDYHSDFRNASVAHLLGQIQDSGQTVARYLQSARWLTITYGTAWVYEYLPTVLPVNNCQKIASQQFRKRLLAVEEIVESFQQLHAALKEIRPQLSILLTVSPVRHLKDTLEGNSVSKSVLRLAVHEIQRRFPDVAYFPAFEIMLDDLRDYRFYQDDFIHPNTLAENYLWEKFSTQFFSETTRAHLALWQRIQKSLQHLPFEPTSAHHAEFLIDVLRQLRKLPPELQVVDEIESVEQKISALQNR